MPCTAECVATSIVFRVPSWEQRHNHRFMASTYRRFFRNGDIPYYTTAPFYHELIFACFKLSTGRLLSFFFRLMTSRLKRDPNFCASILLQHKTKRETVAGLCTHEVNLIKLNINKTF